MKSARILAALALAMGLGVSTAWGEKVTLKGTVQANGEGLFGATVTLVDAGLTVFTDSGGNFDFAGMDANFPLPVGDADFNKFTFLEPKLGAGILTFRLYTGQRVRVELYSLDGSRRGNLIDENLSSGAHIYRLNQLLSDHTISSPQVLRLDLGGQIRSLRLLPSHLQNVGTTMSADPLRSGAPLAKAAASDRLVISKDGYLSKETNVSSYSGQADALTLNSCSRKECIEAFFGPGKTFRIAYMERRVGGDYELRSLDMSSLKSDGKMDVVNHPAPAEVWMPSISPDGNYIAYHTSTSEVSTLANSSIYIQKIGGSRSNGPAAPATNPRFQVMDGKTYLTWCTAAENRGWELTNSATYRQEFQDGSLKGSKEKLADGSYNGGVSPNGRYLAGGGGRGFMYDREKGDVQIMHMYNGGSDTDQVCNASISNDPKYPNRMMFLDFGKTSPTSIRANIVRPQLYNQHQIILFGEVDSNRPGRIVDYIDTPREILKDNRGTWEDPEWSINPEYASAISRHAAGLAGVKLKNIYVIRIPTREYVKIHETENLAMPVIWVGDK